MTKRLTTEKNQKTPEQIEREKKEQENAVKQSIRNEILAPEPVSDADTKVYAGYLAQKSLNSKSLPQIEEDTKKKRAEKAKRDKAEKQR